MKEKNSLIPVSNAIVKSASEIVEITNKLLTESNPITQSDWDWWNSLEPIWKKIFTAFLYLSKESEKNKGLTKIRHEEWVFFDIGHLKLYDKYGSENKPNENELKQILNIEHVYIDEKLEIYDLEPLRNLKMLKILGLYRPNKNVIKTISNLNSLTKLKCRNSNISDIKFLEQCTNLEELDLGSISNRKMDSNKLNDLSPISSLKKLKKLDLSGCGLGDISSLNISTKVIELSLDWNNIVDIKPLSNLINLEKLNVMYNPIENYGALPFLSQLEEFKSFQYRFKNLEPFLELKKLKVLDLQMNQLEDISHISNLTKLEELDLSFNFIQDLTPLSTLINLRELRVEGSREIRSLEPLFILVNLEVLNISFCDHISENSINELKMKLPNCKIDS